MTGPKRIQLKRTKGWRMPENAVKVDRTTRWGNPFTFEDWPGADDAPDSEKRAWLVGMYELRASPTQEQAAELRGKDLACWCPLDQPCHADVLLELANADAEK